MKILGIDLAGKPTNPTGICIIAGDEIELKTVYSDGSILEITAESTPQVIAIDAPLMRGQPRLREADKVLKQYGALPPSLPSMRDLTFRGSHLAAQLTPRYMIIEVFPTATAKILGIYNQDYRKMAETLDVNVNSKHECDAYLCCLTAKLFLAGKTMVVGDEEGTIMVPMSSSLI